MIPPRTEASPGLAEALGRVIQVLRTDAGMSRRELSQQAAISYSHLSAIEAGKKHPSAPVLRRIATSLGMRGHELLAAAEHRLDRPDDPPSRRLLWLEAGATAAVLSHRGRGVEGSRALAELEAVLPDLEADALELLLQMARKLAIRR